MGLSYTSSVFFGTFVPRDSKIGQRLHEKYIDPADGTPAATGTDGVVIDLCGSVNGDPAWITVQIDAKYPRFRDKSDPKKPKPLPNSTGWDDRIAAFLEAENIEAETVPVVGWYFEGTVM
jgi:hypothetical protein